MHDCANILHSGTSCFRIVNPYITIQFFALVSYYTYDVEFKMEYSILVALPKVGRYS